MSRTNISVLIATALLGVLLVLVLRLAGDLEEEGPPAEWAAPPPPGRPAAIEADAPAPLPDGTPPEELPRIGGYDDFVAVLDDRGLDGVQVLGLTARWYQSRGFLGADPLLGITADDAPLVYYESLDDATLQGLREARDLGATQALASRRALTDPFEALDLYAEAAARGSAYAYLQIASLHDTLAAVPVSNLRENRDMARQLITMRRSARLEAFAHAMAALRDSGPPLADPAVVAWINRLYSQVPSPQQAAACQASEKVLLEVGAGRRAGGLPPAEPTPPPAFLTVPDLADRLPCGDGPFGYYTMLDLDGCVSEPALDGRGNRRLLYLCPGD